MHENIDYSCIRMVMQMLLLPATLLLLVAVAPAAQSSRLKPIKGPVQVGKLKMSPIGGGCVAYLLRFLFTSHATNCK